MCHVAVFVFAPKAAEVRWLLVHSISRSLFIPTTPNP